MVYFLPLFYCFTIVSSFISPAVSMAPLCSVVLVLLCVFDSSSATFVSNMDYGGVPLWIDRQLGEPSVLSLQGRMDPRWFRANNPQACPLQCDCPIQWPTALYCDHRGLADAPDRLPERTQYLFLQVEKTLTWELSVCCLYNGLPLAYSGFPFPVHFNFEVWNVKLLQTFFCFCSQGNNISSLSSTSLANITDLRWLILDHNQLQSDKLEQAALQNQSQLCYLFANNNHLTSVPSALPAGLKQLRLAHNQISSISPGAFQNLHNLTLLLLQGNKLQTITEGDLKGSVMCHFLIRLGYSTTLCFVHT